LENLKSDEDAEGTPGVSDECIPVSGNCCYCNDVCVYLLQYFPDKFVRRDIDALEMVCVYAEKGCDWEGTFAKLEVSVGVASITTFIEYQKWEGHMNGMINGMIKLCSLIFRVT
jgi:hypothetical protein